MSGDQKEKGRMTFIQNKRVLVWIHDKSVVNIKNAEEVIAQEYISSPPYLLSFLPLQYTFLTSVLTVF